MKIYLHRTAADL